MPMEPGVYEGDYKAASLPGFLEGTGYQDVNEFSRENGTTSSISNQMTSAPFYGVGLQWSDPYPGSQNDYDLFAADNNGFIIAASIDTQNGGASTPFEFISVSQGNPELEGQLLYVARFNGSDRYIRTYAISGTLEFHTDGEIWGHAAVT